VYNENGEKRIHHTWLNLPNTHLLQILRGIMLSYGTVVVENDILFDHESREFIEGLRFLCLRLSILTGGYSYQPHNYSSDGDSISEVGHDDHEKEPFPTYHVIKIPRIRELCELIDIPFEMTAEPKLERTPTLATEQTYLFAPICSIHKTHYKGTLYDLQMKREHNYMIHNGVVHNGGGKRNGSFAIYLEPWHADIEDFLQMRKNHGDENMKARDLFYALWIPNLFMERVKTDGAWTLMCPDECPGLCDVYGEEFEQLYVKYEQEHRGRKTMKARDLWFQVLDAQMETGTPYILYKDAINSKSNQKNIGTIKSSNLCSEITLYTDKDESAVCNLASVALPSFVIPATETTVAVYNYAELHSVVKVMTYNLNKVIDVNYYPTEKTRVSNMRNRPIGIGVQGLADVFFMLNIPFYSEDAKEINRNIFETIYHAAVEGSMELAKIEGPYQTFVGSPASQGILQFDMWEGGGGTARYDWDGLKELVKTHGLRNSMLISPMPTASTSQILGFNECFEPITSNIYSRRTSAGEFLLANKYLMNELIGLGLWNEELKQNLIENDGSIQHLDFIPKEIREKYRTVWEIPMKHVIDMAADRGRYICQTQSLNLWMQEPNYNSLTSMHFHSYSLGLKTGIYYLRRRAAHKPQQFTVTPKKADIKEDEVCEMCSA
jgi:ribonucleoside-diphosphate reductase alpha chain